MEDIEKPSITIKNWYAVVEWSYNIDEANCSICKSPLSELCPECADLLTPVCRSVRGKCGHEYHTHCIQQWVDSNKTCPLCMADWVVSEC
ncbi:RING-H2 zinc finger protein [Giardia duodenalis]|uniref:RING-H2 zinc finger protein n=1 Tax=Giardia intestinalis TaxID=5741 RepID=V6TPQ9_GIAIN|nr:RING-H2 zinc finger protein [Giardia intestinalis]